MNVPLFRIVFSKLVLKLRGVFTNLFQIIWMYEVFVWLIEMLQLFLALHASSMDFKEIWRILVKPDLSFSGWVSWECNDFDDVASGWILPTFSSGSAMLLTWLQAITYIYQSRRHFLLRIFCGLVEFSFISTKNTDTKSHKMSVSGYRLPEFLLNV